MIIIFVATAIFSTSFNVVTVIRALPVLKAIGDRVYRHNNA